VNRHRSPAAYPDPATRALAASLASAEVVRFDLSDLTPQAFGGGTQARMWRLLQDFLTNQGDPAALARRLEEAAQQSWPDEVGG
jgi:alpha-glucoside transport system substrate-binding protein